MTQQDARPGGLEPPTLGLEGRCSSTNTPVCNNLSVRTSSWDDARHAMSWDRLGDPMRWLKAKTVDALALAVFGLVVVYAVLDVSVTWIWQRVRRQRGAQCI